MEDRRLRHVAESSWTVTPGVRSPGSRLSGHVLRSDQSEIEDAVSGATDQPTGAQRDPSQPEAPAFPGAQQPGEMAQQPPPLPAEIGRVRVGHPKTGEVLEEPGVGLAIAVVPVSYTHPE